MSAFGPRGGSFRRDPDELRAPSLGIEECHPERSEESAVPKLIAARPRFARNDNCQLQILPKALAGHEREGDIPDDLQAPCAHPFDGVAHGMMEIALVEAVGATVTAV